MTVTLKNAKINGLRKEGVLLLQEEKQGEKRRFRLEIEGLRALAALLVAIYHIWFNRVSGGVDVFFVVSGFLITRSLYSMYRREGRILGFSYIVRLLKRLIPTAWTIALITFFVSLAILPALYKEQVFTESIASLLYFENWRLAWDAVDYLGQNNEASPYQHFWALSIQFQFYIIWTILFTLAAVSVKLLKKRSLPTVAMTFIGFISILSFAYSIYLTKVNQPVAYYHTFTRVWEFGIGGLLAFTLHRVQLSKGLSWVLGWLGVVGLISVGIVLKVSTVFPGYLALWPVLAAVFVLLAGDQGGRWSAYSLLSSKPLVHFGKVSYAFYLWHWPLLIFYYAWAKVDTVSLGYGLLIIVFAYVLAFLTIYGIEQPIRRVELKTATIAVIVVLWAVALFSGIKWYEGKTYERAVQGISDNHPGAGVVLLKEPPTFTEDPTPPLDIAVLDRSDIYEDRCINMDADVDAQKCEYGETENYEAVIAVAGGSHSAHWQPLFDEIGKRNNIKITTYFKGRCRFSTTDVEGWAPCEVWMDDVLDALEKDDPDMVFTVGDISEMQYTAVPEGFIEAWERLEGANIPLLLIRDTPRYEESVIDCLDEHDGDREACKVKQADVLLETGAIDALPSLPSNVVDTIDVTNVFCDGEYCYPVIGNVIAYFDRKHLSATFSRSFVPVLEDDILAALEKAKQMK